MNKRCVLLWVMGLLLVTGCGGGTDGALSLPGPNGGVTVSEALVGATSGGWIRGFIVARAGEPVLLCEALAESAPPRCTGASVALRDGVLWREPAVDTAVIGGVADGALSVDDVPCGYSPDGPCTGYPGIVADGVVLWSELEYSVIGSLDGRGLGPIRCPSGADC